MRASRVRIHLSVAVSAASSGTLGAPSASRAIVAPSVLDKMKRAACQSLLAKLRLASILPMLSFRSAPVAPAVISA